MGRKIFAFRTNRGYCSAMPKCLYLEAWLFLSSQTTCKQTIKTPYMYSVGWYGIRAHRLSDKWMARAAGDLGSGVGFSKVPPSNSGSTAPKESHRSDPPRSSISVNGFNASRTQIAVNLREPWVPRSKPVGEPLIYGPWQWVKSSRAGWPVIFHYRDKAWILIGPVELSWTGMGCCATRLNCLTGGPVF